MKQIAIRVTNKNGKEILEFLRSLGYDTSKLCGDCYSGYYYFSDSKGEVWAGIPDYIITNTFDSLEKAKKYYNMEEKELKIQIPEGYEIDKENSTFECIKFKKKQLTYRDVAEKLFTHKDCFFPDTDGKIHYVDYLVAGHTQPNNCTSRKQAEKLLAINKLINVAKYLNGGWTPDWNDNKQDKYYLYLVHSNIYIYNITNMNNSIVYFKTWELAERAIKILGEETIKLVLSTDY